MSDILRRRFGARVIPGVRVISRTSAMRYKGSPLTIPEIARELNVDAVLEGSALLVGNRVRLSAIDDNGFRPVGNPTGFWLGATDVELPFASA